MAMSTRGGQFTDAGGSPGTAVSVGQRGADRAVAPLKGNPGTNSRHGRGSRLDTRADRCGLTEKLEGQGGSRLARGRSHLKGAGRISRCPGVVDRDVSQGWGAVDVSFASRGRTRVALRAEDHRVNRGWASGPQWRAASEHTRPTLLSFRFLPKALPRGPVLKRGEGTLCVE